MVRFILRALIAAAGFWMASKLAPHVVFASWADLLIAALLLGVVNAFIRPVLLILTLPVTLVTVGLFILVVNGMMVGLVDWLMKGFQTPGLWTDILVALIVGITSWVGNSVLADGRRRG